ncbi:MAG: aspartate aminotransferase family protein [Gammaproteobacteria bacterium]|nr:aspartate aminotransferase family protein [Gammaproteobacteria bacterium]
MSNSSTTNAALLQQDQAHMIHPLHHSGGHASGRVWVSGEGSYLIDADGNRFIDGLSSLWNVNAGHGRQELVDAATAQMQKVAFCSSYAGSSNVPAIELAQQLSEICYPNINHFYFTSGGGEATDSNIKLARSYWKAKGKPDKTQVISRIWGYHGVTFAAMCATGIAGYWPAFAPGIPGFTHIPSPDQYRYPAPADGSSAGIAAANELEQEILKQGAENVAMFIAEPVQGAGGVLLAPDDYFPRIREICDKYEVLLVADEVITGFGRTGKLFGLEHYGIQPDLVQFAKAITSGYVPLGGIGITDEIATTLENADKPWMHAYTYSGHPTTCAVGLAMLDIINREDFPGQAASKGEYLLEQLHSALDGHPHVGDVRGKGLMCGVELVEHKSSKELYPAEWGVAGKMTKAMINHGLFTRMRSEVVCIAPPITSSDSTLDELVGAVRDAVVDVFGE